MGSSWWDNWTHWDPGQENWSQALQDLWNWNPDQGSLGQDEQNLWNWIRGGGAVDTTGGNVSQQGGGGQPGGGLNPADIQNLIKQYGAGAAGGGAGGASAGPAGYTTPDGVFVADGSAEDRYYKLVDAVWTRIFGAHPDFAQARVFHDMGIENTDQLNQVILQMPSHIKAPNGTPITIGTYEDMLTTGNKFAQQYLGRPIPDSLISQWVAGGITGPAAIENWFYSHPSSDIPKDAYGPIWDAANNWTQDVWGKFNAQAA